MKNIFFILLILIVASSCERMVEEEVFSQIVPSDFYQTDRDIMLAVNGVYDAIQGPDVIDRNTMADIAIWNMNNMMAGQMNNNWTQPWESLLIDYTTFGVWQVWAECYADVAKANGVLKAIGESQVADELKARYAAEVRYIRAYCYFNQVRCFGRFPLVKNVPASASEALAPTTTDVSDPVYQGELLKQVERDEIYAFIVEDLKFAEENLPAIYGGAERGRVTSGAASGMLARVYLFMAGKQYDYDNGGLIDGDAARFNDCAAKCAEIMTSGTYALQPDFSVLFENDNEFNSEMMFAISYVTHMEAGQLGEGTPWAPENIAKGADVFPRGYNMNAISMEFFADWKLANGTDDLRYSTTFQDYYIKKNGDTVRIGTGNFRGPLSYKIMSNFTHPLDPILNNFDKGDDWVIQRYADVLLMHSEALNEASAPPTEATLEGINLIRYRAGKVLLELPISKEVLREEIWNERKWELCFEGNYHYFDCIRTGRYVDEMTKYMNHHRNVVPDITNNIMPIPFRAMENNPSLKQNAGW